MEQLSLILFQFSWGSSKFIVQIANEIALCSWKLLCACTVRVCNWLCFSCRHISFCFCWLTALSQIWTERGTPLSTPPVCLCPSSLWGWAVPTSVTWTSWTGMMGSSRELMADQPRGILCSLCHLGISRR